MADKIVVIQCAGSKQPNAGHLLQHDGRKVMFVAQPELAQDRPDCVYARPDDLAETGHSWRQELLRYNREQAAYNPLGLLPAWSLYKNRTYKCLYHEWGPDNLYILSAGWGLIRADFLVPNYDITFSGNAEKYKRRRDRDTYEDFRKLPDDTAKPVVFFGGKDYVNLFCELTSRVQGTRHVFHKSRDAPEAPSCQSHKFETKARLWYYEAACAFAEGHVGI